MASLFGNDSSLRHRKLLLAVIGVVRDLRSGGVESVGQSEVYIPCTQCGWPEPGLWTTVAVRVPGETQQVAPQLRALVRDLDKRIAAENIQTLDQLLASETGDARLLVEASMVIAAVAMGLALVGIYGLIAFNVAQRTQEFGVRIAVGAQTAHIALLVLRWGGRLDGLGVLAGLLLSWASTRYMASLLEGVGPTDLVTFVTAGLIVSVAALIACLIPVRRATAVDPMLTLRHE